MGETYKSEDSRLPLLLRPGGQVGGEPARETLTVVPSEVCRVLESALRFRDARARSDAEVRAAIAVACAVGEMAERAELHPGPLWAVNVPADPGPLALATGASRSEVLQGLHLLLSGQALGYAPSVPGAVRLSRACWAHAPALRSIPWGMVRQRLSERRVPLMPAVALLRELVSAPGDGAGYVSLTLEDAAAQTFFKRSVLARAAGDLVSAGLIERAHRPGQRSLYRLRLLDDLAGEDVQDHSTVSNAVPMASAFPVASAPSASPSQPVPPTDLADPTVGHMPILEVAGVAFPIPPGVSLTAEFDAQGRLWYRLGSGATRIGPLT